MQQSTKLLQQLSKIGVCKSGQRYLKTTKQDTDVLIKVWKKWPEYFCEHAEGVTSIIRSMLTHEIDEQLTRNNIYVDFVGSAETDSDNAIFFVGNCKSKINVKAWAVCKIYLYNKSHVTIEAGSNAVIFVEAYNNAYVEIKGDKTVKSSVYMYDSTVSVGFAKVTKEQYMRGQVFNGREMDHK